MPYHLCITLHLLHFWVTACWYAHLFRGSHTAEHLKQATEEMQNACEKDKHASMPFYVPAWGIGKKAMDDMEVPSVGCISHTLQLAVHEGLLSQCRITASPANARNMVSQCCISLCRIRKSHMKIYALFQQNKKKLLRNSLDAGTFFS